MAGKLLRLSHNPYSPAELRQIASGLGQSYKRASMNILRELAKGNLTDWGAAFRKQQLDQIRGILLGLNDETRRWAETNLPTLYSRGLWVSDGMLKPGGLSVAAHPGQYTPMDLGMAQMHREAIQALAEELLLPLDAANTQAAQYTEDMIARAQAIAKLADEKASFADVNGILAQARKLVGTGGYSGAFAKQLQIRDSSLRALAQAFAEGKTRAQASKLLLADLRKRGITCFIDKSGRPWSMDRYAEMNARTIARRTQAAATRLRTQEAGYDLVTIIDHQRECPLCRPWEGKTLSLTGKTPGYPRMSTAEAQGYGHPNCCHAEAPVVP
jgi:hypothetical protein